MRRDRRTALSRRPAAVGGTDRGTAASSHRQRTERLAVEAVLHGDDPPLAREPGQLQAEFGRLGAGVGEKDVVEAGRGYPGEVLRGLRELCVEEQPGGKRVAF